MDGGLKLSLLLHQQCLELISRNQSPSSSLGFLRIKTRFEFLFKVWACVIEVMEFFIKKGKWEPSKKPSMIQVRSFIRTHPHTLRAVIQATGYVRTKECVCVKRDLFLSLNESPTTECDHTHSIPVPYCNDRRTWVPCPNGEFICRRIQGHLHTACIHFSPADPEW